MSSGCSLPSPPARLLLGLLTGALLWTQPAQAQSTSDSTRPALTHKLRALRVETPPKLDGRLIEAPWSRADSATGFRQTRPSPGAPASRRTVARVLYDDDHIYVGVRMYDDPDSIAAQVLGRDGFGYTDRFIVSLGSYNDDRNAFRFRVSPAGSRVDGVLSNDTDDDTSWDGVWTAETHIDSLGWTVEIRIPLSQLRYATIPEDQAATWGLNFKRDIARRSESASWAPLDPNVDRTVSLYGSLRGLRGLAATRNLEISPYTAGRIERPATSTALQDPTEWSGRLGGDVRYGLTPNVSLRATINPDFGQVEADPSRINLSAFETFSPRNGPFSSKEPTFLTCRRLRASSIRAALGGGRRAHSPTAPTSARCRTARPSSARPSSRAARRATGRSASSTRQPRRKRPPSSTRVATGPPRRGAGHPLRRRPRA